MSYTLCEASYIGKTESILCHRLKEHQTSKTSARIHNVESHIGHKIDFENAEIIHSLTNDIKLWIQELIHLLSRRPELNKQISCQFIYEIKTVLIQAHHQ